MIGRINVQVFIFTRNPKFMVLILKRFPERNSYWQPISGGIEIGEKTNDAIKREIYEETGLKNFERIIDLEYSFIFETNWKGKLTKMLEICYATEIKEVSAIRLSNEHEEYKWCTEFEAKNLLKWEYNLLALNKLIDFLKLEFGELRE
jgi:dATP pyrophosphohydrolase